MHAIPSLPNKTSINSLLNPQAEVVVVDDDDDDDSAPVVSYAPYTAVPTSTAPNVDVYPTATSYVAGSTFGLRAASWHPHDDRRHVHHHQRYDSMDQYAGRGRANDAYGGAAAMASAVTTTATAMWAGGGHEYGHSGTIAPMYSDERTALSGDYTQSSYTRMPDNYTTPYSDQWQHSERASARLVARDSSYYHQQSYHPQQQQQPPQPQPPQPQPPQPPQPQPPQPPLKRRSPIEGTDQPKPKRAKPTSAKTSSTSKRGYPAKKRNDAQIAAQNAKSMTQFSYMQSEKGKDKPDAVPMKIFARSPNDQSQALHAEPQSTRCMSTKYKNDAFPRCVACTRRWAGDTCRFQGIRYFLRDAEMHIVGMSFSETQKADMPSMKFPKKWNETLGAAHIHRTKKTIAKALLPTLREELAHLRQDMIIHRPREREVRATCDTCMTSLFASSWLCRLCGREACADCFATVRELTLERPGMSPADAQELARKRESHTYANPFFLQCTKRVDHKADDFSPMSRFCREELESAIREMEDVLRREEEGEKTRYYTTTTATTTIPTPPAPALPTPLAISPFVPASLSALTRSVPTLPIPHYDPSTLTPSTFPALWSLGAPLVVVGLLPRFKIAWTPEYFIARYGTQSCLVIECRSEVNRRVTVGEFFSAFGRYAERGIGDGSMGASSASGSGLGLGSGSGPAASSSSSGMSVSTRARDGASAGVGTLGRTDEVWKLKDWPPSMDFKKAFPELWEDFGNAVPVPSYVRRDGVLNMASHFPEDAVVPDIGPKMYNAMATTQEAGSKGSTRLHMDMADALNIMTYAAPAPDGSQGCAAWDLFRAEDSDKIRTFLAEHASGRTRDSGSASVPASASASASAGSGATNANGSGSGAVNGSGSSSGSGAKGGKEAVVVDWKSNDPIHGQQFYLDEEMREKLYRTMGVKSYRFYQRPGEAVFIPAGCAHQVANLADCIKVAVDFVSPENVERCERLTREFRAQNQRKMWKEDVLQLRTMMWFAWLSCRRQEKKGVVREANGEERE